MNRAALMRQIQRRKDKQKKAAAMSYEDNEGVITFKQGTMFTHTIDMRSLSDGVRARLSTAIDKGFAQAVEYVEPKTACCKAHQGSRLHHAPDCENYVAGF